jgi:hypothetical protein
MGTFVRLAVEDYGRSYSIYFWEINTKSAHVETVEESAKILVEAVQTLIQKLQVHEVGF